MRTRLLWATVWAALGAMLGCFAVEPVHSAEPNVLFLICDDLNCDMSCYGHPQVRTPNIDRLAARGVRFDRAYCQYPLCGPSRASFMTSMYPDQTLIRQNSIFLRETLPNVITMAQAFRRSGYYATRIGKIYHYNVPKHIGTGGHDDPYSWDETMNPRGRDKEEEASIFSLRPGSFGGTLSWLAADGADAEQTDGIAADWAVRQLQRHAEKRQRFFLAVGLYRPHTPFVAPKRYFDMYPLDTIRIPKVPDGYFDSLPEPARRSILRKRDQVDLDPKLARQAIQAYYASISFADAQIGKVLDALAQTGLQNNTLVVFTSDHGYHMGEHGHYQKTTLFENAARVPLIIAGPGVEATGQATGAPVEMTDIYPTLTDLAGVSAPKSVQGISLKGVLGDVSARPRKAALTQYAEGYSIRTERFRYTEWGKQGALGRELYDHEDDPAEMTNLADRSATEVIQRQLAALLRARLEESHADPGVVQLTDRPSRRVPQPALPGVVRGSASPNR